MYHYKLYCDDADVTIVSPRIIPDLGALVRKALGDMSKDEILRPANDWFEAVVDKVCEQNGCSRPEFLSAVGVEDLYWDEHGYRESNDD